jgi:hypothetical protein
VNLRKAVAVGHVTWRTLKRWALRQQLWNGNRERMRDVLSWDPYRSTVRWTRISHAANRQRYRSDLGEPRWRNLTFVRLSFHKEMRHFFERPDPSGSLSS